jgi:ERCC4-type nuclease
LRNVFVAQGKIEPITVAIDTREQRPYAFSRFEVKTLKSGDYSIVGWEDRIAIERKTKEDAYACLGRGRRRFEREMARLSRMDYAALVVESTLEDFLKAPAFSQMNPRAAANSLLGWSVKYNVCVHWAGNRRFGNALTRQLLEKYWRYHREGLRVRN